MNESCSCKILILVWPEASAYNATLRLGRALLQRGWQVTYAAPARWQDALHQQGFETRSLPDSALHAHWASSMPLFKRLFTRREAASQLLDGLCESFGWVRTEGYSLVLLYPTLWHFALVFQRLGVPYLATDACLGRARNPEIPPLFSELAPARDGSPLERLACAWAWLRFRYFGSFNHRYRGVMPAQKGGLADAWLAARHFWLALTEPVRLPVYYRLLHDARKAGIRIVWGDYGHRLSGPELVLGPQALDFYRQRPDPERVYAGTCVDGERAEEAFDWRGLDGRPAVYCTIGSHGGHWNQANIQKLLGSVALAFKAHPEWQLILQVPGKAAADRLGSLPENVLAAAWFPQWQAMQRASLVICHGGFGTLREALFYGLPVIVYPLGVDQPGNAARVVFHHLGLAGDVHKVTPGEIADKVSAILNDPTYRQAAVQMGQALRAGNDCERAIAFLETYLRDRAEDKS